MNNDSFLTNLTGHELIYSLLEGSNVTRIQILILIGVGIVI